MYDIGLAFLWAARYFFILLKATVPYTLGDISVDTNMYYPLGTYLSDSTYCGEQFLEDASPFYSFDENKVKLFSYDSFGRLIKINNTPFASYDSFGRPVSYNGNILSWYGGNLKSFGNINLYYDLSGRRIKKVNGNKVTHYLYDEQGRLLREKFEGSDVPYITYMYDSSGAVGFMLPYAVYDLGKRHINERPFYYVKDITGNIRKIVDSNGKCVIKYDYDAWGRVINTEYSDTLYTIWENAYFSAYSIGQLNSLIYKDYYYDKDLELYCLQTRYYDPTVCRFISPDHPDYLDYESINGLNLYAYCLNSPVMYYDPTGHFVLSTFLIGLCISVLIGTIVGGASYAASELVSYSVTGEFSWSWAGFVGNILGGAIGGAFSAIPGFNALTIAFISGFASSAIGMALENEWEDKNYTFGQIMLVSIVNGTVSILTTSLFNNIPIKGINVGSGRYSAITSQITSKFFKGTIKRISFKTFSKMLKYNLIGNIIGALVSGLMDAFGANDWLIEIINQMTGW